MGEFKGFGRKYIEALDKDYPELSNKLEQEKISIVILGLMKSGLNRGSILEQLKDIENVKEHVDRVTIALLKIIEV
jgi:hypothetical protein